MKGLAHRPSSGVPTANQRCLLLEKLPVELLVEILGFLEASSFSTVLFTCKTIRNHALKSTALLNLQINKLPRFPSSHPLHSEEDYKGDPFQLFLVRAGRHLKNTAHSLTDAETWIPSFLSSYKNSILKWSGEDLLLVTPSAIDGKICIYNIAASDCRIRLKHLITPLPGSDGRPPKVIKTAVQEHDGKSFAVLCQYKEVIEGDEVHSVRLSIYRCEEGISDAYCVAQIHCFTEDPTDPNPRRLTALSFTSDGNVLIAEARMSAGRHVSSVTVFCKNSNASDNIAKWRYYPPCPSGPLRFGADDLIVSNFHSYGQTISLIPPWLPMHCYKLSFTDDGVYWTNVRPLHPYPTVPAVIDWFDRYPTGISIAKRHDCDFVNDKTQREYCVNTLLQLSISKKGPKEISSSPEGVFLVRCIHLTYDCEEYDEEMDFDLLTQTCVAQLDGVDISKETSLGIKVAISESKYDKTGHRIAIATWDSVMVYDIDHRPFLLSDPSDPPDFHDEDVRRPEYDHAFYHSYPKRDEMIVFEPLRLPVMGVVYDLVFADDYEIWAWTDRGLVRWYFGPSCSGMRCTWDIDELCKS